MSKTVPARDVFVSRLGILAATLGSAVGLGNIWKFPALTGEHGGACFLLVYILSTLFVGLPVMIAELAIGRSARANAVSAFRKVAPHGGWWLIGLAGVISAVLILGFYTEVAGWVFAYVFQSAAGNVTTTDTAVATTIFQNMVGSSGQSLFWQWVVIACMAAIILRGASKGIERAARVLMPILFLLLVVVCIRSLTLPNAGEGLRFLFMPDFSQLTGSVVLMALGLAFFKLSTGIGIMLTYGSYFRDDVNIPLMAVRVMVLDLFVSLLAGIAIFPAVFSFGFEPTLGPSLLFMTIPAVFASMPGGQFFTVIFFILSAVAATGAMLSLMEVPVACLMEMLRISRKKATLFAALFLVVLGVPAALSEGAMAGVRVFGMTFFNLYDFLSSNLLMPVGALFTCLFTGYIWGRKDVFVALSNNGTLRNERIISMLFFLCRYVSPLLILIVLLKGLNLF